MQVTVTQQHFHQSLTIVSHAVPSKPSLPIQSFLLATTDGQRVRLSAMREEMGIHCWMPVQQLAEAGTMLLPAQLITSFVGNFPAAPVTITSPSPADATACRITCQRIKANIKNAAEDCAEFPLIPSYAEGGERLLLLDAALLKQIIRQIAFAAGKDDNHPAFTGIQIQINNGTAMFAAADAFRLAVHTIALPDDQLCCTLLIPARTMTDLAKILPHQGAVQMMLTPDRHQLLFHTDTMDLSARLLHERFPDVRRAIPTTSTTRAVVHTQELAEAIRLMQPFANVSKHIVHLTFVGESDEQMEGEPQTVKLQATAQDVGTNEQVVNAQVQGPNQKLICNANYLSDVLSVIDEPEVAVEITTPVAPVALKPVGESQYVAVVMPMTERQARAEETPGEQAQTDQEMVAVTR